MSKIKCNKCGADIKIKTLFLERAGCENCGNSIDFTKMDSLSGLRQGLMFAAAVVVCVAVLVIAVTSGVDLAHIGEAFAAMSAKSFGLLLFFACVLVIVVGFAEKTIGCVMYEKWRKREEELERIAQKRREERATDERNANP